MELNMGRTPSDPLFWTPTQLVTSLVNKLLKDDAAASSEIASSH